MDLCEHLRWKGWYGQVWATADDLRVMFERNDVPYDCTRTCQPWGPDEDVAAPEACTRERVCFQRSSRLPVLDVT